MEYTLEKSYWNDADFEQMGWGDVTIYQMAMTGDLEFDIDYIFKWNEPELKGFMFTFWIAPCTLVFRQIRELRFDMDVVRSEGFRIDYIERSGDHWTIVTRNGELSFISEAYEMFVRQQPMLQYKSSIGLERGGYSLDRVTDQHNPYWNTEAYIEKRKKEAELYGFAQKCKQKKLDLEALEERRLIGEIDTLEFLRLRRELQMAIDGYGYWLKGTQFENT
ncbi:hypothetical protein [Chitinophaga sancti]|uniref:Uncharacterized protein n=1 Tax=Chitinophaga sancti TaxID=1004 RepID=A0A1K1NYR3_9BACT|nr:hypothetical protein [Chitinophaga sancti]WQD60312.1 hypothetical protein U0033_20685 [Chitinophaga sancti]WQG87560.1 hypothetical protein SR876_21785 [Chitinophaga sancti]SFW40460.1 hypothetical protein SAMN05661012_01611 [Chitinophaga sancti]